MNGFIGVGTGLSAKPRVKTSTGAFLKLSKQGLKHDQRRTSGTWYTMEIIIFGNWLNDVFKSDIFPRLSK